MRGEQTFDSFDVLYIEITGRCNLNCAHCGNEEGAGDLEYSLIEKAMQEFNDAGGKKLILTGGEPLLHPELERILELAATHEYNTKLSTNGTLITEPKHRYVLDHDLGFRLSLDGTQETHNKIRRNPHAYEKLIRAMEAISEKKRQIIIRTTVMQDNKESIVKMLYELDELTRATGIKIYSNNIWPVRNIGGADPGLMLTADEYDTFLKEINEQTRTLKPTFRIIIGPTFGCETMFEGGPIQSNQIYRCDILNTSLHIASNGDIYPCSFVHHSLGNISETPLREVFRSERSKEFRKMFLDRENHDCDGCKTYDSCRAGCIAEKYRELGKHKIKDVYCTGSK